MDVVDVRRRRTHGKDDRASSLVHMQYFFHSVCFFRGGKAQYALIARKPPSGGYFLGTGTFEDLRYLEGTLDADVMGMKYLQVDGGKAGRNHHIIPSQDARGQHFLPSSNAS